MMTPFEPDYAATIRAGRAYMRIIEAAAVLVEWKDTRAARAHK